MANSDYGEREGEKKDRDKKKRQKITQRRPDAVGVNAEHRAAQSWSGIILAALPRPVRERLGGVPRCL